MNKVWRRVCVVELPRQMSGLADLMIEPSNGLAWKGSWRTKDTKDFILVRPLWEGKSLRLVGLILLGRRFTGSGIACLRLDVSIVACPWTGAGPSLYIEVTPGPVYRVPRPAHNRVRLGLCPFFLISQVTSLGGLQTVFLYMGLEISWAVISTKIVKPSMI